VIAFKNARWKHEISVRVIMLMNSKPTSWSGHRALTRDRYGANKIVFTDRQILRRIYTYTEVKQTNKQYVLPSTRMVIISLRNNQLIWSSWADKRNNYGKNVRTTDTQKPWGSGTEISSKLPSSRWQKARHNHDA